VLIVCLTNGSLADHCGLGFPAGVTQNFVVQEDIYQLVKSANNTQYVTAAVTNSVQHSL
jgi:hypothetical protein